MSFIKKSKNNERKGLVRVLEVDKIGKFTKKVLGFGVKMKKNEATNTFMFITSSSVLKHPLLTPEGSRIVIERYCSHYPKHSNQEDHSEEVYKVASSVDDNVSFVFFEGKSEEGFLELDDGTFFETLPMHGSLHAYAFDGKDIVELTFEDKDSSKNYRLTTVSKGDFQVGTAKGAPVISYDRLSEKPTVVGILHTTSDGTLYPIFLTSDKVEVKSEPKEVQQGETPPQDKEKGPKPVGGNSNPETEEVDSGVQPSTEDKKDVLVVTGINQTKDKIPVSIFEEETKCLKYKRINEALPQELKIELQMSLDPDRPFGGDVQSLADAFGYIPKAITYLKSLPYPTQTLLQQKGNSTLLCLVGKLTNIERPDLADLIDKHIKDNCACKECGNLR